MLGLVAVIEPATPLYSSLDTCGVPIPILSAEWFATVVGSWGIRQVCLLGAAGLVLLVAYMSPSRPSGRRLSSWMRRGRLSIRTGGRCTTG
ncbi:hypothetical protein [Spongiactinospora sp. TRM90649]|uniref:hypothetical protein n=1 Tax=Spongiactinospora sp. TRM90649 TaxID=3031114 RepID=UPI0023F8A9EB|nr:hypothetical protein [Spongiactinospora sp. TRM90649]MDF5751806.1 hypothetical protein [Spongiactinospora sp. TRM90649]